MYMYINIYIYIYIYTHTYAQLYVNMISEGCQNQTYMRVVTKLWKSLEIGARNKGKDLSIVCNISNSKFYAF